METLEQIQRQIAAAVTGAQLIIIPNGSPAAQHSLLVDTSHALEVARFLRENATLRLDYLSNVTGVDWPEKIVKQTVKSTRMIDGQERRIEETVEERIPGFLEVVYHLYSIELKHGPLILRVRTTDRAAGAAVPSLTPVWRGAEFQEREVFDLFGVTFTGHPDLRRILMWDEFKDYPMRKDYVDPDDYEYEPTAHGEVLERARRHGQRS